VGHEREGEVVTEVAVEAHERRKHHDPAQVTECIVTCMPETSPKAREAVSSMMMNGHPKTLEGNPDKYVCDKSVSNVSGGEAASEGTAGDSKRRGVVDAAHVGKIVPGATLFRSRAASRGMKNSSTSAQNASNATQIAIGAHGQAVTIVTHARGNGPAQTTAVQDGAPGRGVADSGSGNSGIGATRSRARAGGKHIEGSVNGCVAVSHAAVSHAAHASLDVSAKIYRSQTMSAKSSPPRQSTSTSRFPSSSPPVPAAAASASLRGGGGGGGGGGGSGVGGEDGGVEGGGNTPREIRRTISASMDRMTSVRVPRWGYCLACTCEWKTS